MKRNLPLLLILLVSIQIFTSCNRENNSKLADHSEKIDRLLTHLNNEGQFNGAFFLANKQKIIFREVYGYLNIYDRKDLNDEIMFEIASVSKTLTATLIMKLIEKGELSLDTKLIEYFPEMPLGNRSDFKHRYNLSTICKIET